MNSIVIRRASAADAETWLSLVDALADYEKLERPTADARERLERDAFGPRPRIQAWLAEGAEAAERNANGLFSSASSAIAAVNPSAPLGYAITFETYSSFLALPTLYLEDLFVLPEHRKAGVGRAFFRFLAREAIARGCGRMEWAVLDWNQLAIDFYERLGARRMKEWQVYRLTADQLREIAAG